MNENQCPIPTRPRPEKVKEEWALIQAHPEAIEEMKEVMLRHNLTFRTSTHVFREARRRAFNSGSFDYAEEYKHVMEQEAIRSNQ